jgi:nicotinate-nucleotide adenylyltransferase
VDTLRSLREELGNAPICLILGMDAFCRFDEWHQWKKLPALAHISVAHRPGSARPESGTVADLMTSRGVSNPTKLRERCAGYVIVQEIPALDISATRIRALLNAGQSIRYLVPDPVNEILKRGEPHHA